MVPLKGFQNNVAMHMIKIEQGAHYIRKSLIYSTRKAFLKCAVAELVYKFDEKSYRECLKR